MNHLLRVLLCLLVFVCFITFNSCSTSNEPSEPLVKVGAERILTHQIISTAGGEVRVLDSSSINGLTITIPANSYNEERMVSVSTFDILSHQLGADIHPISPIIRVSNGGKYSDSLMILRIPTKVPAGHFAMAFSVNTKTGSLEGLPILESESDHITIGTRHFDFNTTAVSGKGSLMLLEDISFLDFLISSVDTNVLMTDYSTPFKPGVDDFQFPNYGSIACEGHCSGQSIGMLWYYSQKKLKGSPPLFGRFDNNGNDKTPELWQDDVLGYKFCGCLQLEQNRFVTLWHLLQKKSDVLTMRAFSYALRATNEPQFVHVYPNIAKPGHAMVVYGIKHGTLELADPNYPGNLERHIVYDDFNRVYVPYFTGSYTGAPGIQFPNIAYEAKSAIRSWDNAALHWQEVANGTIGHDVFPSYTLLVLDDNNNFVPLENGFKVQLDGKMTLSVRGKDFDASFVAYDKYGSILARDGNIVTLPTGAKKLGIYIVDKANKWVDFKWITVESQGTEMPGPTNGYLKADVDIDGVPMQVDSATFRISGSAEAYFFPEIRIYLKNKLGLTEYVQVTTPLWRGGEHEGICGVFTYYSRYFSHSSSLNMSPDLPGDSHVHINEWGASKFSGSFKFQAFSEDRKTTAQLQGSFSFLR